MSRKTSRGRIRTYALLLGETGYEPDELDHYSTLQIKKMAGPGFEPGCVGYEPTEGPLLNPAVYLW